MGHIRNVQPEILNILKENLVKIFVILGSVKISQKQRLKARSTKEKNGKLGFIKINDLFFGKLHNENENR